MWKDEYEFGCEWKDVRCDHRESQGRSDLNGESGSEIVCGEMEGNVIKADVDEGKVVSVLKRMKQKGRPVGMIWMTVCRVLEGM